ncbi:MAG: hypothetical protein RMJ55_19830 [Roseiflexaceae bacterium]|nr:hypothetical protein [Roseiflexaceae bacterium]MDW8215807.1 hypothetical protein [Roseiflexaceae bacterium]
MPWLRYDAMCAELTELFMIEAFRRRDVASALVAHTEWLARGRRRRNAHSDRARQCRRAGVLSGTGMRRRG